MQRQPLSTRLADCIAYPTLDGTVANEDKYIRRFEHPCVNCVTLAHCNNTSVLLTTCFLRRFTTSGLTPTAPVSPSTSPTAASRTSRRASSASRTSRRRRSASRRASRSPTSSRSASSSSRGRRSSTSMSDGTTMSR